MSYLIKVFKSHSSENKISKNLKILLFMHAIFMIATGMSNIFLNVFIWKETRSFLPVIYYNMASFITLPITFIIGGWLSKRKGFRLNIIMGMMLYTCFYFIVFLFRSQITPYIYLIGILRGISSGFYYVSFNVLGYDFSTDKNRDYFFGLIGIISNFVTAFSPFISGYVISSSRGLHGYEIIFISSFILFFAGSMISFSLPNKFDKQPYQLGSTMKLVTSNADWSKIMFSESFRGTRDTTVMSIILTVLVYILVQEESIVGNYSLWTAIAGIIACYFIGIFMNSKSRTKFLFLGVFIIAFTSSIFLFEMDILTFWIYGIITSISLNMISIPHNTICFSVISSTPNSKSIQTEALVVKEIFLNIGRLSSLLIFIPICGNKSLLPYYILIIGILQIPVWTLLRGIDRKHLKRRISLPDLDFEHKILGSHILHEVSNTKRTQ